jgi:Right handed beta helix region
VVIRNLYLNGQGARTGINYQTAASVTVEDCVIANFTSGGIVRNAASADQAELVVTDTVMRGNALGLSLRDAGSGSIDAQIDHSRADRGTFGFAILDNARATITDSIAARNSETGFAVETFSAGPALLFMEHDTASGNGIGIQALNGQARGVVSNSTIVDNTTGVSANVGGSQLLSRLNNTLTGNTTDGAFTGTVAAAYRTP